MAHGFSSVDKTPEPGLNLGAMVAGKIKDSFGMAAEERKARDEEIAKLQEKTEADRTDQESQRLAELLEQKKTRTTGGKRDRIKNSFFTKAMMSQFGGDRARRIKGTFSKNPKPSQDPSLTKEQRFSALLDEGMGAPAEAPDTPADYDDSMNSGAPEGAAPPQQSGLDKALSKVSEALAIISTKVSALKSEEAKSKSTTESRLSKFNGVFESIKNYFDRDNDLKETENSIEQQKIDNLKDAQADAKADRKEASMDNTIDGSGQETVDKLEDKDSDAGGGIMKGIKGLFMNFMGGKKGGKGIGRGRGRGGKTQYTAPVGPQPMNSATPWAAKGAGERGGTFGQSGFAPRLPSKKLSEGGVVPRKKLNKGGVYDNPTNTTLNPGDAVVPLNRNNPIADSFKKSGKDKGKDSSDPSIASSMADIIQLPTKVAGGLVLTKMSQVFSGVAGFIKPVISPVMNAIAPAFGLPATIISGVFGGAAQAAGIDMDAFTGKKSSKTGGKKSSSSSSGGGGGGDPPAPAAAAGLKAELEADLGKDASGMKNEIMESGATGIINPEEDPWCAAYVNSQLVRQGIRGSGSPGADSYSDWGAPVEKSKIKYGDVIVGDYGGGTNTHVMFAAGEPKDGAVDIIGGNQSGKVSRGRIELSKIGYVRRASDSLVVAPGETPPPSSAYQVPDGASGPVIPKPPESTEAKLTRAGAPTSTVSPQAAGKKGASTPIVTLPMPAAPPPPAQSAAQAAAYISIMNPTPGYGWFFPPGNY